jgi:hypothetical protein
VLEPHSQLFLSMPGRRTASTTPLSLGFGLTEFGPSAVAIASSKSSNCSSLGPSEGSLVQAKSATATMQRTTNKRTLHVSAPRLMQLMLGLGVFFGFALLLARGLPVDSLPPREVDEWNESNREDEHGDKRGP